MAGQLRKFCWFVAIWAMSVASLAVLGLMIRAVLR